MRPACRRSRVSNASTVGMPPLGTFRHVENHGAYREISCGTYVFAMLGGREARTPGGSDSRCGARVSTRTMLGEEVALWSVLVERKGVDK